MKESMWGYYLSVLGVTVSMIMIFMSNMTTTNQQDYYLLKEVASAAMIDSIDYGYYSIYGEMKINTEKFVENFIRRFSEGVSKANSYKLDFYSIYENPPSASIKVTSKTGEFNIVGTATNADVVNSIDIVLESNNRNVFSHTYYALPYAPCNEDSLKDSAGYCKLSGVSDLENEVYYQVAKMEIKNKIESQGKIFDENKVKILNIEILGAMENSKDYEDYLDNFYYKYIVDSGAGITELRSSTVNDIPHPILDMLGEDLSNYFAESVKDYNISFREIDGKTKIFRSVRFRCDDDYTFGKNSTDFIKKYRKKATGDLLELDSVSYSYNPKYFKKGFASTIRISGYDYFYGVKSASTENHERYSNNLLESGYENTPYYDACLVGVKYKIDYYYDET